MTNAEAVARILVGYLGRNPTLHEVEMVATVLAAVAPDLQDDGPYEGRPVLIAPRTP